MTIFARVGEEPITRDDIIKHLAFTQQLEAVLEEVIHTRVIAQSAHRQGYSVAAANVQRQADALRRSLGLHKAADTHQYLRTRGLSVDDFLEFVRLLLQQERVLHDIASPQAVENEFARNRMEYQSVECGRILVDDAQKASQIARILAAQPDQLGNLARSDSLDSLSARNDGRLGRLTRYSWPESVAADLFAAAGPRVIGPFEHPKGMFDVVMVFAVHEACLDQWTQVEVKRRLVESWLKRQAQVLGVSVL